MLSRFELKEESRVQRMQYATLQKRGVTERTWDREAAGYLVART